MKYPLFVGLSLTLLALNGCVTHITTDVINNPPPAEKFSDFNRFELTPIQLDAADQKDDANHQAVKKIQENLTEMMNPVLKKWRDASPKELAPRTLLIEPAIRQIKFLNATVRVWTGSLSGSSAVILDVKITDKDTGKVIATPFFYARAAAMAGAFTFGVADNLMLERVAERVRDYLQGNYSATVGGLTGQDPPKKSKS